MNELQKEIIEEVKKITDLKQLSYLKVLCKEFQKAEPEKKA